MNNSPHRLPMTFGRKPRRDLFVKEYLHDLNATKAAQRAGYSKKAARVQGHRLLTNAAIAAKIQAEMDKRAAKLEITGEKVLRELALMGFANMYDYMQVQPDGTARVDLSKLTREQAAAIQEITVDDVGGGSGDGKREAVRRTRLKLLDKIRALEHIGRHLKLFPDKVEVSGELGLIVERLQAARRRCARDEGEAETRDPSASSVP